MPKIIDHPTKAREHTSDEWRGDINSAQTDVDREFYEKHKRALGWIAWALVILVVALLLRFVGR